MSHEEFQKIAIKYAEEHGFKIFVAAYVGDNMHTFGDDLLQQYFHGLMSSANAAREYFEKNKIPVENKEDHGNGD